MDNEEDYVICNKTNFLKVCGNDAVCRKLPPLKNPYCFCVQTGKPMNKDIKCGLNIVNREDSSESKLEIQVQPAQDDVGNNTNAGRNIALKLAGETPQNTTNATLPTNAPIPVASPGIRISLEQAIYGSCILAFVCILFCVLCCCFRLKKKTPHKEKDLNPIRLEKSIIKEDRYTRNHQYAPTPNIDDLIKSLSVPTLNKESMTDLKKIGEGYFGEVYKGQLHSIDVVEKVHLETVAVKMLKGGVNAVVIEDFLREVEIMSSFQHPNILTFIGVCPQGPSTPPWMVFEYMPLGDLAELLRSNNDRFCRNASNSRNLSGKNLLSIALQISSGMEYLAAQRFVHRDLACRNCLVGEELTVKISDFGMSRDVYTCDYYRIGGTRMLPIRWMSPESVSFGKFTLESDIWSYGVLLWEIYTFGLQPYFGYTNEQVIKLVVKDKILLDIPANCPTEIAEIMRLCWKQDAKERIQFIDICNKLSVLKDQIVENPSPVLPRPPPMPVTVNYPLAYDDDEDFDDDDDLDEDNYLRPTTLPTAPLWPEPDTEPETEPDTEPETEPEIGPETEPAIEREPDTELETEPETESETESATEGVPVLQLESNPETISVHSYIEMIP